jgi:hypothetical protein
LRPSVTPVGATAIDSSTAGETVRSVVPGTDPYVAEMVLVPGVSSVATPVVVILATVILVELHAAKDVTFELVLSA